MFGMSVSEPLGLIQQLTRELDVVASRAASPEELMAHVVELLHERMPKYNWVGFYMIERSTPGENDVLGLGSFAGAMTPHTRIPLNQGICGAAASSGRTIVVDNVRSDPRYLACSIETRSEIVVPIFVKGKVVGELDIDSHFPAAFGPEDRQLVEYCTRLIGQRLETKAA